MKLVGSIATVIACTQLISAPLAMAEEAKDFQVKKMREYLKTSGLGTWKNLTVGEFYKKTRGQMPEHIRGQMDVWVAKNRHEMMPALTTSTFKDSAGRDQAKLFFKKNGEELTVSTGGSEDKPVIKVNSVTLDSKYAATDYAQVLILKDPKVKESFEKARQVVAPPSMPSFREFVLMSKEDKAYYFYNLRRTVDAAENVFKVVYGKNANNKFDFPSFYQLLLDGESAFAADEKPPCLYAGWSTVRGEKKGCGGIVSGDVDFSSKVNASREVFSTASYSCSAGTVTCNPYVYGFDANNGAFCVPADPRAERNKATVNCNDKSPLGGSSDKDNQKRIVQSWLKAQGQEGVDFTIDEQGKVHNIKGGTKTPEEIWAMIEKGIKDLNSAVAGAESACPAGKTVPFEQKIACTALRQRGFQLELGQATGAEEAKTNEKGCGTPIAKPLDPQPDGKKTVCGCVPGTDVANADADKGKDAAIVPAPVVTETEKGEKEPCIPVAPVVKEVPKAEVAKLPEDPQKFSKEDKKCEQKSWYSCNGWMWAVGAGIGGFLLGYSMRKTKTKTVTNTITNTVTNTVTVPGPTVYVPAPVIPTKPASEGDSQPGTPGYSTSPTRTTN